MWHAWLGATLTKAALPIAGAAATVILSLSVALWWTNSRLDAARATLAESRGDLRTCIAANASQSAAIEELERAQARNRQQIQDLRRREQDAINRVTELEARQDERTTETIERVIRVADGDACAHAAIPDALKLAATGN